MIILDVLGDCPAAGGGCQCQHPQGNQRNQVRERREMWVILALTFRHDHLKGQSSQILGMILALLHGAYDVEKPVKITVLNQSSKYLPFPYNL